jgi:peptidyl-prolyl cis-trans isomerase B (cyclophilin B)
MLRILTLIVFCAAVFPLSARAQKETSDAKTNPPSTLKKSNRRPDLQTSKKISSEPFDTASVETMAKQCVRLETGAGVIELEMFPESAPETVRNFLNLTATGAFDTTTFSRIVPGFVVQGGNLGTRAKLTQELVKRAQRTIPDEPNLIKHERAVVSMARSEAANTATTNFFILLREAPHLDGSFAAFGRVTSGMEIVDAINKMPVEGEKPTKPVQLTRARVMPCPARAEQ